jgi:ATPases with chaperone activity, ATP-binding subunit
MDASPNLLSRIAARIVTSSPEDSWAVATLVSPLLAVTSTEPTASENGTTVILRSSDWPSGEVAATFYGHDADMGIALLRLASAPMDLPDDLLASVEPPVGSAWESFQPGNPGGISRGTVTNIVTRGGRRYLNLVTEFPSTTLKAGCPVLVGGRLGGIVGVFNANERLAIPMSSIAQSSTLSTIGDLLPLDEAAFFARLSPSSLTALGRARNMTAATGQDRIHMEHLILALHQKQDGPAERLFAAGNITAGELRNVLTSAVEARLPLEVSEPATLTSLPAASKHVLSAFIKARNIANAKKSDRIQSRHLLYGALSVEDCTVIQSLTKRGVRKESIPIDDPVARARAQAIAGFGSDEADGEDQLGIEKEVEALCMVLAAKEIEPPISLGLFGDWGSGKSFFMKKMEDWFKRLKDQYQPGSPYCSHIVQLKFNAWHYSDTNLWASLTAAILQGLAEALSDKADPDSQYARAGLQAKKELAQSKLAEAQREKSTAEAALRASQERLQQLDTTAPPEHVLREAFRAAITQPEFAGEIQKTAKELGVPQVKAAAEDLKNELLEVKGIWDTLALTMRSADRRTVWLICLAAVSLVSIGVPALFWAKSKGLGESMATAATLLSASAALIARIAGPAVRALRLVNRVRQSAQGALDRELQQKKATAEQAHRELQSKATTAQAKVDTATGEVSKIDQDLDNLRPDRQMTDFIRQRFQSADYTSQLGVISRARKDFEQLTTLLAQVRKLSEDEIQSEAKPELLLPRIDRIILYVDDLDRCPEDKVVDVLQAVHLLLAFKLFVVVVGVDPRWLLHSLTQHSTAFQEAASGDTNGSSQWRSTPLNYLEKIFQIPFTLRPMEKTGFGNLIGSLTAGKKREEMPVGTGKAVEQKTQPASAAASSEKTSGAQTVGANAAANTQAAASSSGEVVEEKKIPMDSEALRLETWERNCMKELDELIPSPRSAKRFVNVYRLLRGSVDEAEWTGFIGDENNGLYRPVLMLLAILTGYPAEATEILRSIIERRMPGTPARATTTFWALIDEFEKSYATSPSPAPASDGQQWRELIDRLRKLRKVVRDDQKCSDLIDYAPQIARYSFQSGRILLSHVTAASSAARSGAR